MSKKSEQIKAAMAQSKQNLKLVPTPGSQPAPLSDGDAPTGEPEAKPKATKSGVPPLPKMPRAKRSKKKTPKECECGCGDMTAGGRFIPGHDSKLKAWALRVERKVIALKDIEHPGIRAAVAKLMKVGGTPTMVAKKKGDVKPEPVEG